jgi:ribose transport system ATP-binding protein
MDEIKRIADRVTVMRDGQYIDTLPAADDADVERSSP